MLPVLSFLLVALLAAPVRLGDARPGSIMPVEPNCCDNPDRVCCDGSCFPPGTQFFAPCESTSCGCPNELNEDCCPPDFYCCYSRCSHNSVVHVWCGPPDAPTCCDVLKDTGDVPTDGPF